MNNNQVANSLESDLRICTLIPMNQYRELLFARIIEPLGGVDVLMGRKKSQKSRTCRSNEARPGCRNKYTG